MVELWRRNASVHRLACLVLGAGTPVLAAAAALAGRLELVPAIAASVVAVGCAVLLLAVLAEPTDAPPDAPGDGGLSAPPPPHEPRDPGGEGLVDWERFERELADYTAREPVA